MLTHKAQSPMLRTGSPESWSTIESFPSPRSFGTPPAKGEDAIHVGFILEGRPSVFTVWVEVSRKVSLPLRRVVSVGERLGLPGRCLKIRTALYAGEQLPAYGALLLV